MKTSSSTPSASPAATGRPFGASSSHPSRSTCRATVVDRPVVFHAKGDAMAQRRSRQDDRTLLGALDAAGARCDEIHLARDSSGTFSHDYLAMAWHQDRVVSMNKIHSHADEDPAHT